MNQIFQMILNKAMARVIDMGVRKGTDAFAKRTSDGTARGPKTAANQKTVKDAQKLARMAARATRIGR